VHPKVEKRCSELWCQVPPGCFTMGLRSGHTCGGLNETSHQVALSRQVVISETEVTQAQFSEVMKYSPTTTTACKTCPVDNVTWNEAAAYCNGLSTRAGLAGCYTCSGTKKSMTCSLAKAYQGGKLYACPGFRLPTSAEWEYAYRAGTTGSFYNGKISSCSTDSNAAKIGWYQGNALGLGKKVQKVGGKLENPLGLHDMAGNLWEWVHDYYKLDLGKVYVKDPVGPASGSSREYRGGCWKCQASDLRGARRNGVPPSSYNDMTGFRCLRSDGAGLAAHWKLEKGSLASAVTDSSGNGHHGTMSGGTWTTGALGGALSFNGSSASVSTPYKPSFTSKDNFTLSAWVKAGAATSVQDLMGFEKTGGARLGLVMYTKGQLALRLRGASGTFQDLASTKTYRDSRWHLVTATRQVSTSKLTLYVDGVQVAQAADKTQGTISAGTYGVALGSRNKNGKAAGFLKGELDDVRVYTRALAASEIRRAYERYSWATHLAGTSVEAVNGVAVDKSGNSFVTGSFTGTATLGGTGLTTTAGKLAMFVAKLSPSGKVLWSHTATGTGTASSEGNHVALDSNDDVYVYGKYTGAVTVGNKTFVSKGKGDVYLARYDSAGKFKAALTYGGTDNETAAGLVIPPQDTPFIAMNFSGSVSMPTKTFACVGKRDSLVIKLSSGGQYLWATHLNGPGEDIVYNIAATSSGVVYATGSYTGKPLYGNAQLASKGAEDIFVAKLKSTGGLSYARGAGGTGADWGADIAILGSRVLVTGSYETKGTFGSISLVGTGGGEAFVAELDLIPTFKSAITSLGSDLLEGKGITVSSAGDVYVAGGYANRMVLGNLSLQGQPQDDLFVAKIKSVSNKLTWAWARGAGGDKFDSGRDIALIHGGRGVVVVGGFQDKALFGTTAATSKGSHDGYIWMQAVP